MQVEPNGSAEPIADGKAFIRQRIIEAVDALDAAGKPELTTFASVSTGEFCGPYAEPRA